MKKELSEVEIVASSFDLLKLRGTPHHVISIIDIAYNGMEAFEVIDVPLVKQKVDEAFLRLLVMHRFCKLRLSFNGKLDYNVNDDCFIIEGHKFATLDQVEKALNNKAFL